MAAPEPTTEAGEGRQGERCAWCGGPLGRLACRPPTVFTWAICVNGCNPPLGVA